MLAEWDEMKKLYRGPYIDAICQVLFHLAQLFQRSRLKYEKVNGQMTEDDHARTPSDGNTSHDPFGSGELKRTTGQTTIYKTLHIKLKTEEYKPHKLFLLH